MVPLAVFGVALVIGLALLIRGIGPAGWRGVVVALRGGAVAAAVVGVAWLAVTGRLAVLMSAAAALAPILLRWQDIKRRVRAARGPAPGRTSDVTTRTLRMVLDHDTGRMTGTVLAGAFAGRSLDQLGWAQLMALLAECRTGDPQAVGLLEAWLDRTQAADWRTQAAEDAARGSGTGPRSGTDASESRMTQAEAYAILGLAPGASPESIKEAYHHLMMKLHPDLGGTNYFAAKLNQARDLLLRD